MKITVRPKTDTPTEIKRTPRDCAFVKHRDSEDFVCFPLDEDDEKHVEIPFDGAGECYAYDDSNPQADRITRVRIVEIVVEEL